MQRNFSRLTEDLCVAILHEDCTAIHWLLLGRCVDHPLFLPTIILRRGLKIHQVSGVLNPQSQLQGPLPAAFLALRRVAAPQGPFSEGGSSHGSEGPLDPRASLHLMSQNCHKSCSVKQASCKGRISSSFLGVGKVKKCKAKLKVRGHHATEVTETLFESYSSTYGP